MNTETQKRLAIFLPSLVGGGAEKSMVRLANGLAARGKPVDLVLAQAKGPYLDAVSDQVRMIDLKASRVLTGFPALLRYLRRERPHAMLSALDFASIVLLWARRLTGIPRIVAVNEQNTISISSTRSRQMRQRLVPRLMRFFYPWADHLSGNSSGVADDLAVVTGLPRSRIQVVYNPVVTPELLARIKEPLKHPWYEAGQPPVFVAVGRLTEQKDFPTLIRAFAEVRQKHVARLLILGEGRDRSDLESLVKSLNLEQDVSLFGFVDNPYAFMTRSVAFVLSSRWEGLPTVLIEALACGVPVIATNCPSGPDEILAGGKYGLLVPVQDVAALAEAMRAALNGKISAPPSESWLPYEQENIVSQYSRILEGQ